MEIKGISREFDTEVQIMEKEINLREVLEVLLKQKWIIIIITVASILFTALFILFVRKDIYETVSIVNVQSTLQTEEKKSENMKLFSESLKSSAQLKAIIEKNQLDGIYTIDSLRNMFRLEASPDNSYIKIITKGEKPEQISQIANLLAFELGTLVEVTDRSLIIGIAEKRLTELSQEIAVAQANLSETQKQLNQIKEVLVAKQVLSDNELLRSVWQESANTDVKSSAKLEMESEMINPTYTSLQTRAAEASIALSSLLSEETVLKQKVSDNRKLIEEIENKPIKDKLNVSKTERVTEGSYVITISPSVQPTLPIGSNFIMITIFAAILGVIISLFIVFLRHQLRGMAGSVVNV